MKPNAITFDTEGGLATIGASQHRSGRQRCQRNKTQKGSLVGMELKNPKLSSAAAEVGTTL